MKKTIKIISISLGALLVVIITLPYIFKDKIFNKIKEEINNMVNAKITYGNFHLSVFKSWPNINIGIENLCVAGINEFEGDTLIATSLISVDINFWSVIGATPSIKAIMLNDAYLQIKTLKGGKTNYDITKPSSDTTKTLEDTTQTSFSLKLNKVSIINGTIIYDDQDLGFYTRLDKTNFTMSGDLTADVTLLKTLTTAEKFTLSYEGVTYIKNANLYADAELEADIKNFKFTFKNNTATINALELGFDGWVAMPYDDIDMDISFEAKKTEFKNLLSLVPAVYLNDFNNVKTDGKLALKGFAKGTYNDNSLPAFDLSLLVENGMFKYPDLPDAVNNINIDLNIKNNDGNTDHTVINLSKFHADVAKNPFDMKMLVQTPMSDPYIDGIIKGKIDLASIKNFIPINDMSLNGLITADVEINGKMSMIEKEQYEQFHAIGNIAIDNLTIINKDYPKGINISKCTMEITPKYFDLKTFDSKIETTDLHLNGKIENFLAYTFRDSLLKGNFIFKSEIFNCNQFLTDDQSVTQAETNIETESILTAFQVPENIDFTLNSTITKILYDNIDISNASGLITINSGTISLKNLKMNMLDGGILMNGSYSTYKKITPEVDFNMNISNFDVQKTFKTFNTIQKLAPIAEKCTGNFSTELTFSCKLNNEMIPEMNTINGIGLLKTKNITINNTETFKKISDVLGARLFDNVNLQDVVLSFKIEDGKINVEPFDTKIGGLMANIFGSTALDQTLDYNMKLTIPKTMLGGTANQAINSIASQLAQKGIKINQNENLTVNVKIDGTVLDPKVSVDIKEQAKEITKDIKEQVVSKINEEVDKKKQEALKVAQDKANKIIADADVKAQQIIQAAEATAKQIKDNAKIAADKVRSEGNIQANNIVAKAGNNPIAKAAAQKTAETIRKEANDKATKIEIDAAQQADAAIAKARSEADAIKQAAKQQSDKTIQDVAK